MYKKHDWINIYECTGEKKGGGNADVYFVRHKITNEEFALKELRYEMKKIKNHIRKK